MFHRFPIFTRNINQKTTHSLQANDYFQSLHFNMWAQLKASHIEQARQMGQCFGMWPVREMHEKLFVSVFKTRYEDNLKIYENY